MNWIIIAVIAIAVAWLPIGAATGRWIYLAYTDEHERRGYRNRNKPRPHDRYDDGYHESENHEFVRLVAQWELLVWPIFLPIHAIAQLIMLVGTLALRTFRGLIIAAPRWERRQDEYDRRVAAADEAARQTSELAKKYNLADPESAHKVIRP